MSRQHSQRTPAPWNPIAPERAVPAVPVYADGFYIVSQAGEATTWAVFDRGRWGLVYECDDRPALSAWVDEAVVPLHVLAEALGGDAR